MEPRECDPLLTLLTADAGLVVRRTDAPPLQPEMFTKQEAAAMLSVSVRTLDRLVARGEIPHVRFSQRCVRFPLKALKNWIESKTKFRK